MSLKTGIEFHKWSHLSGCVITAEYYRYDEELVVPIIENTPHEKDLKKRMAIAMEDYPDSCAVLVRRHGVYVWGPTWEKAKTM